jgi:hypothetical protein
MSTGDNSIYICSSVLADYTLYLNVCLENLGYQVNMLALLDEYKYRKATKKGRLAKLYIRFGMYFLYPLKLAFKFLCVPSGTIFIITSNTFYASAFVAICARLKNQKVVNLVYDLYPDALEVAGKIKFGSTISRLLGNVTRFNCRVSDYTVYLGRVLRKHAETRWGKHGVSGSIDISADIGLFKPNCEFDGDRIHVHYGGQLGQMHDADSVVESILSVVKDEGLQQKFSFSFRVGGSQVRTIEKAFAGFPVQVLPPIPSQEWRNEIRSYNIGLVTLSPGGATVCLPSKSYAMMAGGLPILAICPLWSDLGQMILSANAGWVIPNSPFNSTDELLDGDYQKRYMKNVPSEEVKRRFVEILRHISETPAELAEKRIGALHAMKTIYGAEEIGMRWKSIIDKVSGVRHRGGM